MNEPELPDLRSMDVESAQRAVEEWSAQRAAWKEEREASTAPTQRTAVKFLTATRGETVGQFRNRIDENLRRAFDATIREQLGQDVSTEEYEEAFHSFASGERFQGLDRDELRGHVEALILEAGGTPETAAEILTMAPQLPAMRADVVAGTVKRPSVQAVERGLVMDRRTGEAANAAIDRGLSQMSLEEYLSGDYSKAEAATLDALADTNAEAVADAAIRGDLSQEDFSAIAARQMERRSAPQITPRQAWLNERSPDELREIMDAIPDPAPQPSGKVEAPEPDDTAAIIQSIQADIDAHDAKHPPAKPTASTDKWASFFR